MPQTHANSLDDFLSLVTEAVTSNQFNKLLLSQYQGEDSSLDRLSIRPVILHQKVHLSFTYEHQTNHITKNHLPKQGLELISDILATDFRAAYLSTHNGDTQLSISKKGVCKIVAHKTTHTDANTDSQHNREKKRYVDSNRPFLCKLGVTDSQHNIIPAMSSKWKQINKFIEVFQNALDNSPLHKEQPIQVVDFGSGKGYLTFAIHDYLSHSLHNNTQVCGVELRQALVDLCNKAACKLDQQGLSFVCGDVKTHAPKHIDVMIALHACDMATDYAIHYGIRANASIIMCSPCCHKQIRPQMKSPGLLKPMLQYGVHMGQQAEMVTDALRALLLEAHGYSTKVFEFISLEHTNKNKMILATKKSKAPKVADPEILQQVNEIKQHYGISEHCLETLLNETQPT